MTAFTKIKGFVKKEAMLTVSVLAALLSFLITPPSKALLTDIDWKTLATLFMLLSVLDGFKHEDIFNPVIRFAGKMKHQLALSFFLVFSVFFSSMFVTNDVSLIIFVPLTMLLFQTGGKEHYIIPVLVLENIAAVRGSLLTPFGSPQNLFLYAKSGLSTGKFLLMMLPIWLISIVLLSIFLAVMYRKNIKEEISLENCTLNPWQKQGRVRRIVYLTLFAVVIAAIVSRTQYWYWVALFVTLMLLIFDRRVFLRVDYALIITFLCFFVFSSSIAANRKIAAFLSESVAEHEYLWSILLSQLISNVPAAIVLWPFTSENGLKPLIYGLDSAGLVTIIGSLASVINLRLYSREYPGNAGKFMLIFEKISLIFFVIVFFVQLLLL